MTQQVRGADLSGYFERATVRSTLGEQVLTEVQAASMISLLGVKRFINYGLSTGHVAFERPRDPQFGSVASLRNAHFGENTRFNS